MKIKPPDRISPRKMSATLGSARKSGFSSSSKLSSSSSSSSSPLHRLLSPDGYYDYLGIPRPPVVHTTANSSGDEASSAVDEEVVKKNYRRLSLRHHPDRRGGDAETFRVLNRAKKVLTSPKLRKQYDLLGLDLHDEEEESNKDNNDVAGKSVEDHASSTNDDTSHDTVMSQIASATLASILQVTVRTILMMIGTTVVSRFKIALLPLVLFLLYTAYGIKKVSGSKPLEIAVPLCLALGVIIMHAGRATIPLESDPTTFVATTSTWLFFFGEMVTINVFFQTSLPHPATTPSPIIHGVTACISFVLAFALQGRFWRYAVVVACEGFLALLTVLIFPVMEMLLEEIMNEKLKKVGEKIRAHGKRMESEINMAKQNGHGADVTQ